MGLDYDTLSLTEIIQIQTSLSEALRRRFQKKLALIFTDVVGSTQYFARFGDEAGRGLQQRHFDLLQQVLPEAGVVAGKTMTSWPSVRTDLKNAGANWVDKEVVKDGQFITSRKPDDLEAFCKALLTDLMPNGVQAGAPQGRPM